MIKLILSVSLLLGGWLPTSAQAESSLSNSYGSISSIFGSLVVLGENGHHRDFDVLGLELERMIVVNGHLLILGDANECVFLGKIAEPCELIGYLINPFSFSFKPNQSASTAGVIIAPDNSVNRVEVYAKLKSGPYSEPTGLIIYSRSKNFTFSR